eukprot:356937_1
MSRETITINIGSAGIRLTNHIWERYYEEYDIDTNGKYRHMAKHAYDNYNHNIHNFFEERDGTFIPRNISIDTDRDSFLFDMDVTPHSNLLDKNGFICNADEDAAHLFSRPFYLYSIDKFNECIRKSVEKCDNFQGFILNHSINGGTGSGLTSKILQKLRNDYQKSKIITFSILSATAGNLYFSPFNGGEGFNSNNQCVVQPYNGLMSVHHNIEECDLCIIMDNMKLYEIVKKWIQIKYLNINLSHLNELIIKSQSMFTNPLRYKYFGYGNGVNLNNSLNKIITNLCPIPRLHFCFTSFTPIKSKKNMSYLNEKKYFFIKFFLNYYFY